MWAMFFPGFSTWGWGHGALARPHQGQEGRAGRGWTAGQPGLSEVLGDSVHQRAPQGRGGCSVWQAVGTAGPGQSPHPLRLPGEAGESPVPPGGASRNCSGTTLGSYPPWVAPTAQSSSPDPG